jgi:hypothetical protein
MWPFTWLFRSKREPPRVDPSPPSGHPEIYDTSQGTSLAKALHAVCIHHGDDADVLLEGIGVEERQFAPRLNFCPAQAIQAHILREGTPEEQKAPMPTRVVFSEDVERALKTALCGKHGFAHAFAHISTNGVIRISEFCILGFEAAPKNMPVNHMNNYKEFQEFKQARMHLVTTSVSTP